MPAEFKFEVVSLTQVPIENAPTPPDLTLKDLEALSADDAKNRDLLDVLQPADALEIPGLPRGLKAWITQQPGQHRVVLETRNGDAELVGEYDTLKDAMYALSTKLRAR
jgi:hypothetical protein